MSFDEMQLVQRVSTPRIISVDIQNGDIASKLAEERSKNEEIRRQLTLEKARADRLQKKVQFIQDNQDLFNQLKEAYSTLKLTKGIGVKVETKKDNPEMQVGRALQDSASQTTTIELIKNSQITAVSKKDLAEVSQLIQELKQVVTRGGKRVFAALESDRARDDEDRKRVEVENLQLKRELFHKSSELERLRSSAGSGPREVTLLRRIIMKLINAGNDLSCLSNREASLARFLAKKYEYKYVDDESKMLVDSADQEQEEGEEKEEKMVCSSSYDFLDKPQTPKFQTPSTPLTPKSPEYSTPRWNRAEDVP